MIFFFFSLFLIRFLDRLLYIYFVKCRGELTGERQKLLGPWIGSELGSAGSEKALADRWNLDLDELRTLINLTKA